MGGNWHNVLLERNACDTQMKLTATKTKYFKLFGLCMTPIQFNGGMQGCGPWLLSSVGCKVLVLGGSDGDPRTEHNR
jgi:hypothetical protein